MTYNCLVDVKPCSINQSTTAAAQRAHSVTEEHPANTATGNSMRHICTGLYKHRKPSLQARRVAYEYSTAARCTKLSVIGSLHCEANHSSNTATK